MKKAGDFMQDKKLNPRSFVSLLTFSGFIIMSFTGIVLYFTPQGRVAYWTDWKFLGLTKVDWGNIHIISCFLFIVVGLFHLYYNWKPLTNYLSDKASHTFKLRKELMLSLIHRNFSCCRFHLSVAALKSDSRPERTSQGIVDCEQRV
jgi:hypothetical protein